MRRAILAAAPLLLGGCGVAPSGVEDAGPAPTGIGPGATVYFLDDGELRETVRRTGRLGTIADSLALLLTGPGDADLDTGVTVTSVTQVAVTVDGDEIGLRFPLAATEVTALGADQIVCTAVAAHVQAGGSTEATVRIDFTIAEPESDRARTCPIWE